MIFAEGVARMKVRIDGARLRPVKRAGPGCLRKRPRCVKWRIYAPRQGNECFELIIRARPHGGETMVTSHTVCEPFRTGTV